MPNSNLPHFHSMKQSNSSTTQVNGSTKQIVDDEKSDRHATELKNENMKLIGEVTILRQNIIALEKQNFELKEQRSRAMLEDLRAADRLKREMNMLRVENRIKENQLRVLKRPRGEATMDIKWALSKASSEVSFSLLPFEYRRLKFLKDYFFADFCQLDTQQAIREMKKKITKFKDFLRFYILFSCRVDVFREFFCNVFMNPLFPEEKLELFETLPLDWLLNFEDESFIGLVKEYIECNYKQMVFFFTRVVEERPFLLNILITKDMFTEICMLGSRAAEKMVSEVCRRGGLSLVDHTNLHIVPKADLKVLYKGLYFDCDLRGCVEQLNDDGAL
jgi:hypothetical protein